MKNKTKVYAEALAGAVLRPGADGTKIKNNFFALLEKNRDMKKAKEIISLAEDLFIKKTGRRKVILETATKIKSKQREILGYTLQKGDIVEERINPGLLAGVRIIINDEQLDLSMKNKINKIFS